MPEMLCGSCVTTIGATKNTAVNADTPAAVLLSRAPRARPITAATVRYSDAPTMVRSTPGSDSEIADAPRADWMAVATKNSATAASRVTGSTSPAIVISFAHSTGSTSPAIVISFAHSTGSRDGTTASEARIIPVPYSPLNASTPSTPSTSWASRMPYRLTDTAVTAGCPGETRDGLPAPSTGPMPEMSTNAARAQNQVEGSARSL